MDLSTFITGRMIKNRLERPWRPVVRCVALSGGGLGEIVSLFQKASRDRKLSGRSIADLLPEGMEARR